MSETVVAMLEEVARRSPERPALMAKRNGTWQKWTWMEYRDEVRAAARGLIALGLEPGQRVTILSSNRPEWFFGDLAAIACGAVPTGLYPTGTVEQWSYVVEHCGASVAFVEDPTTLERFAPALEGTSSLGAVVLMSGSVAQDRVVSWEELKARGGGIPEADLEARISTLTPEQLCTLIYTSGTTGPPKAVMLSHRNITWTAQVVGRGIDVCENDELLCYLPLSHIAEQVVSLYTPMVGGACIRFAESLEKFADNLREVRPTLFLGVPRVWEKIQAAIQAAGASNGGLKRRIAAWARGLGLAGGYAEQRGEPRPLLYPLADRLVFSAVRTKLGFDRTRLCAVSTAPIARETLEFFLSLGIPIMEVYGMSECTGPTTLSLPGQVRTGWAGKAMPGAEVELAPDGEILMRGPHVFLGYYRDESATQETLDEEGWLHSGDIGELGDDGFLRVTDRKKDLIITSGGKNVAPQPIEAQLRSIPGVAHAVVVGDRRRYLVAVFTLDPERLDALTRAAQSPATDVAAATTCAACRAYLEGEVSKVNAKLARFETIKRFSVLEDAFSVEGGQLTPTLKMRRRAVQEKYAEEIERLYA
jgi:long-subunit acyl-CoA synthetase (AMP-forming)